MSARASLAALAALLGLALGAPAAGAAEEPCPLVPKTACFGVESLAATLSTEQAGDHPDLSFSFDIKTDPETAKNSFGLRDAFAPTRNVRIELPPGLIGDPSVLGAAQQCSAEELASWAGDDPTTVAIEGGCPNASQVGVAEVIGYGLNSPFLEPVYMMDPPGEEGVVARIGLIAGLAPIYIDASVRSESDYGIEFEIVDAPTTVNLIRSTATTWGVPVDKDHDNERCTPQEVFVSGCMESPARPPGGKELPFITNPTRCGVPLEMRVAASSWVTPGLFDTAATSFPEINGCNKLTYGPSLALEPTSRAAGAPTGLDVTFKSPAAVGPEVLEPSQTRDIRVSLAEGYTINTAAAEGLETCSAAQVRFGKREPAQCPDAAKLATFESEIPALARRLKGAIYLREPEPGNLFRFWAVADDLGANVKLPGRLIVDHSSGQIETVLLDAPQAPLREVRIQIKSGYRAPLVNPPACGEHRSSYEFVPWSGGPPERNFAPVTIELDCAGQGGFDPKLAAGAADPTAAAHTRFLFTLTREDGEQNPATLTVSLPRGLSAKIAGIPRCEGAAADLGQCPAASRIGRVIAAAGVGPRPLWVPQPGKRDTAVYLAAPYKGAPLSVIAVVPAQAGPFDLGDEVVRSAIHIDPATAQGTVRSDPLPQIIEGVPVRYRTAHVVLDRPDFTLNPSGCSRRSIDATVTSTEGAVAHPSVPFTATGCARLGFKPRLGMRLFGGTRRGAHPSFQAVLRPRPGDSNLKRTVVRLPRSAFLDQAHIRTVCTRVQYAANQCPPGSIYGRVKAFSPLLDEPLSGPVYLRSSSNPLPDVVFALRGLIDVEAAGRIDSVNGGIRATFAAVPDAPLTKAVIRMQGGRKGLIVNSRNLCKAPARARVQIAAHNGRRRTLRPKMRTSCKQKKRAKRSRHRAR